MTLELTSFRFFSFWAKYTFFDNTWLQLPGAAHRSTTRQTPRKLLNIKRNLKFLIPLNIATGHRILFQSLSHITFKSFRKNLGYASF